MYLDILLVGGIAKELARSFRHDIMPSAIPHRILAEPRTTDLVACGAGDPRGGMPALNPNSSTDGTGQGRPCGDTSISPVQATVLVHIPAACGYDPILHEVLDAIRVSSNTVVLQSSYMILSAMLQHELVAACRRGVVVRLVTNSAHTQDMGFIHCATCRSLIKPANAGAHVYFTMRNTDHSKFMVVDEDWVCIGSWNCWLRSSFYEAETNVVIKDNNIGRHLLGLNDNAISPTRISNGDIQQYTSQMLVNEANSAEREHSPDRFSTVFTL